MSPLEQHRVSVLEGRFEYELVFREWSEALTELSSLVEVHDRGQGGVTGRTSAAATQGRWKPRGLFSPYEGAARRVSC